MTFGFYHFFSDFGFLVSDFQSSLSDKFLSTKMLITIIIFIIILGLLVFVHELGHFLAAKRSGVRVDEFGFGFPPRIFGIQRITTGKIEKIGEERKEVDLKIQSLNLASGEETISEIKTEERQDIESVVRIKKWHFFWGNKPKKQEGEIQRYETVYSINAIPLGGFVKIYGEEGEGASNRRSFMSKGLWQKMLILFAGVGMNFVLAILLFSAGHFIGLPTAIDESEISKYPDAKLQIVSISKDSPAEKAGIMMGDFVVALKNRQGQIIEPIKKPSEFQAFVNKQKGNEIVVIVQRGKTEIELPMIPRVSPPSGEGPLGVGLASVVNLKVSWYKAISEGFLTAIGLLGALMIALWEIIKNLFIHGTVGVDVVGPVGIFSLTGQAETLGFIYLLQLTAMLSINLAVINAFPFPALDGGRALFLLIEKIKGSPINIKTQNLIHNIGFALLILLIVAITYKDIVRFF